LIAMGGAAMAHHSFAMFDNENQIGLEGVVQEFKRAPTRLSFWRSRRRMAASLSGISKA
jgi:hypothetical protein